MSDAGVEDLQAAARCPIEDQGKIAEMLRLALSREMRDALIGNEMAASEDVDAAIAAIHAPGSEFLISSSMVA